MNFLLYLANFCSSCWVMPIDSTSKSKSGSKWHQAVLPASPCFHLASFPPVLPEFLLTPSLDLISAANCSKSRVWLNSSLHHIIAFLYQSKTCFSHTECVCRLSVHTPEKPQRIYISVNIYAYLYMYIFFIKCKSNEYSNYWKLVSHLQLNSCFLDWIVTGMGSRYSLVLMGR